MYIRWIRTRLLPHECELDILHLDISTHGEAVVIQTGRVKKKKQTNGRRVSSNYTTYILVSPSCNIPTNNIRCNWSHQLHRAGLHEILIPTEAASVAAATRPPDMISGDNSLHLLLKALLDHNIWSESHAFGWMISQHCPDVLICSIQIPVRGHSERKGNINTRTSLCIKYKWKICSC